MLRPVESLLLGHQPIEHFQAVSAATARCQRPWRAWKGPRL